jgi:anti-sigma factor RsiW
MKPCVKNRKPIAWLALGALETEPARELRRHLETCAACRAYLGEVSDLAGRLRAAQPEGNIQTSESFHRRVAGALRAASDRAQPGSAWTWVLDWLREAYRRPAAVWRAALPLLGATALALVLIVVLAPPRGGRPARPAPVPDRTAGELSKDLPPTIANYRLAANRSLEALDELLTQQGKRRPLPGPVYRASAPWADGSE